MSDPSNPFLTDYPRVAVVRGVRNDRGATITGNPADEKRVFFRVVQHRAFPLPAQFQFERRPTAKVKEF